MTTKPISNRPVDWACPVADTSKAKASCEAIDQLNDYGTDGKVSSGVNAGLVRMNKHDSKIDAAQARIRKSGGTVTDLEKSAVISVDTTAWVSSPDNQSRGELTSPSTWWAGAKDKFVGHSEAEVLKALAQAKRNAAEFVRNIYAAADGRLPNSTTGERMEVRIVPTSKDEIVHRPGVMGFVTEGRIMPWSEDDNLNKTPHGVEIGINSETLRVPTAEELTAQWNKGLQFDDEKTRLAWSVLNPGGPIRTAAGLIHQELRNTLGSTAQALAKDLRDVKSGLGDQPAKMNPQAEAEAKQKVLDLAKSETVARGPAKGQSKVAATDHASLEKTINSMSKRELNKFVATWLKSVENPKAQEDAISAAAQITRNVVIKSRAEATGAKYSVAVANGHDIDVVAQVAGKGNGIRFTHLIDAPVQTVNIDTGATAQGKKVAVAVSTPDAIRVFAQVGGMLNENKVLGTGTLQEALAEIGRARNTARAALVAKVTKQNN